LKAFSQSTILRLTSHPTLERLCCSSRIGGQQASVFASDGNNLLFNANLQEFAQRVMIIANLETAGKITPEESYQEIKLLWNELRDTKRSLSIGERSPFGPPSSTP